MSRVVFFCKEKTAYEVGLGVVGWGMCIRGRLIAKLPFQRVVREIAEVRAMCTAPSRLRVWTPRFRDPFVIRPSDFEAGFALVGSNYTESGFRIGG